MTNQIKRPEFAATCREDAVAMLGDLLKGHDCMGAELTIARMEGQRHRLIAEWARQERDAERENAALRAENAMLRAARAPWWETPLAALTLAYDRLLPTPSRRHNAACVAVVVACIVAARILGGL